MTLNSIISSHLGFAGLGLSDLVRKAQTTDELRKIAADVIALIRSRKGDGAAEIAARQLFDE